MTITVTKHFKQGTQVVEISYTGPSNLDNAIETIDKFAASGSAVELKAGAASRSRAKKKDDTPAATADATNVAPSPEPTVDAMAAAIPSAPVPAAAAPAVPVAAAPAPEAVPAAPVAAAPAVEMVPPAAAAPMAAPAPTPEVAPADPMADAWRASIFNMIGNVKQGLPDKAGDIEQAAITLVSQIAGQQLPDFATAQSALEQWGSQHLSQVYAGLEATVRNYQAG